MVYEFRLWPLHRRTLWLLKVSEKLLKSRRFAVKDGPLKALMKRFYGEDHGKRVVPSSRIWEALTAGRKSGNYRSEKSLKPWRAIFVEMPIEVLRNLDGELNVQIIPEHQPWFNCFGGKIISMYTRDMTTWDIQNHLFVESDLYGWWCHEWS